MPTRCPCEPRTRSLRVFCVLCAEGAPSVYSRTVARESARASERTRERAQERDRDMVESEKSRHSERRVVASHTQPKRHGAATLESACVRALDTLRCSYSFFIRELKKKREKPSPAPAYGCHPVLLRGHNPVLHCRCLLL
jgi:hypothetical protein